MKKPRRRFCLISLLFSFLVCALYSDQPVPFQSFQLTRGQQESLRALVADNKEARAVYDQMRGIADKALVDEPKPIAEIRASGLLDADSIKIETREALKDCPKTLALAIAWTISGDQKYLAKAAEFLVAWASLNRSRGRPIDDTNLEPMIRAYDFVKSGLEPDTDKLIAKWLRELADAEIESLRVSANKVTSYNNYNSHRLKIVGLVGYALDVRGYVDFAMAQFDTQLEFDLYPDGSSYDFAERDALHYHLYTLEPLLDFSIAASLRGIELLSRKGKSGASLQASIDFIMPYIRGDKTHEEFVDSKVAFDTTRADAGQEKFLPGRVFEPTEALLLMEYYYYFEPRALEFVKKFRGTDSAYPSWAIVLETAEA